MDRLVRILFVGLSLLLVVPSMARADDSSTLMFSMPEQINHADDIIPVALKLDSHGLNINAVDVTLNFSRGGIRVVRVEKNLNVFPLWPDEPTVDNLTGRVHFSTGRPNGLIAAGATLATVYIQPVVGGLWQMAAADVSRAYVNDGEGTAVLLQAVALDIPVVDPLVTTQRITSSTHPTGTTWYGRSDVAVQWTVEPDRQYSFAFSADPAVTPDEVPKLTNGEQRYENLADGVWWFTLKSRGTDGLWGRISRRAFLVDTHPPEAFTIMQLPSGSVGGAMVISWVATDSMSGISSTRLIVGGRDYGSVRSPLAVRRQWAGRTLSIRVRDAAGNVRSVSWRDPRSSAANWWPYMAIGGGVVVLLGALVLVKRSRHIAG